MLVVDLDLVRRLVSRPWPGRTETLSHLLRLLLRRRPIQRRLKDLRNGSRFAQLGREGLRPFFEGLNPLREDE